MQAAPNHGLFCKAGKLTREPAVDEDTEISFKVPAVPKLSGSTTLALAFHHLRCAAAETLVAGAGGSDESTTPNASQLADPSFLLTSTPTGPANPSPDSGQESPLLSPLSTDGRKM